MSNNLKTLRCPACVKLNPSKLKLVKDLLVCTNDACRYTYNYHNDVPLLLTNSGDFLNYYSKNQRNERKNKSTQKFTK